MNKEDIYNSNYEKVRHFKLTLANGETLDLVDMKEYQDVLKKYSETKKVIDKAIAIIDECRLLMPHEFDCGEQIEQIEKLLKEVE